MGIFSVKDFCMVASHFSMRHFLILCLFCGLLIGLKPLVVSDQTEIPAEVLEKLQQEGKVGVIIGLDIPFTPTGFLPDEASAKAQEQSVKNAQGQMRRQLGRFNSVARALYTDWSIPFVAYEVQNQNVLDFSNNDYKFQSVLGTDTFGYQITDNILGYGITGAVNSWSNSSDFALSGFFDAEDGFGHNTLFNYGDGTDNKISLLKNSVVLQLNNSSSQKGSLIFSNISFALTNNTSSGNRNGIIFNEANSGLLTIGNLSGGNNTKITIDDVNEQITISNLSAYDDDTAAGVGGLTAGMVYMTTGSGSAPLNAAGILMIKQ